MRDTFFLFGAGPPRPVTADLPRFARLTCADKSPGHQTASPAVYRAKLISWLTAPAG